MPPFNIEIRCRVEPSFRVAQIEGMFGLSAVAAGTTRLAVDVPSLHEDWTIGTIVGPSGSGKTSIAKAAFAEAVRETREWPERAAMIDGLPPRPIRETLAALLAVGLGDVPAWLRPYRVLSGGQQFRADLAAALLEERALIVLDEFTGRLDRTAAKFASLALGKALRRGTFGKRLVAVSCHDDIVDWLNPDWVVDLKTGTCHWRTLREAQINIEIVRARPDVWRSFAAHHYLGGGHLPVAQFYAAQWQGEPVAVAALVGLWGKRGHKRVARLVTLPDHQGASLGTRLLDGVARLEHQAGFTLHITASHPAIVRHCERSPHWRRGRIYPIGREDHQPKRGHRVQASFGRPTVSYQFRM